MSEMNKMNDQRWENHSDFLADFAGNIAYLMVTFESSNSGEKIEAVEHLVKNLSFSAFRHAEKHLLEDFENGLIESGKVVDELLVDDISVSGDLVKREPLKLYPDTPEVKREGPSWDKDKKGWDMAKREPHVYANTDSVGDDDSVIKTQEDCAKRFAEGQAVRRNYAGIND